jgi:hypothetical protein
MGCVVMSKLTFPLSFKQSEKELFDRIYKDPFRNYIIKRLLINYYDSIDESGIAIKEPVETKEIEKPVDTSIKDSRISNAIDSILGFGDD